MDVAVDSLHHRKIKWAITIPNSAWDGEACSVTHFYAFLDGVPPLEGRECASTRPTGLQ